ncbi:MAG: class I SAM-dependent methyltransferase [Leptolyngbyaceae cyanobacterium MO_188.B28]|nr:class I SAM-dependent methyltransferase [Leptolyngbyaceae cyanobacterium MO_188.B28]
MDEEQTLQIFFEIHQDLPREGPGAFESTQKAFLMLPELPKQPLILDLGCGPGMQTLDLISLTDGNIVAVDNHQPYLDQLRERAAQQGVSDRISVVNGDMAALDFQANTFDVIWAEGSAYIIGFEQALRQWKPLLKKSGCLAATEVAWIKANPPEAVKMFWAKEYPAIQDIDANLTAIRRTGFRPIGHFILPQSAWWEHYYTPLQARLQTLQEKYQENPEALTVIELHQQEIDLYRQYADFYGYVFYVMQAD